MGTPGADSSEPLLISESINKRINKLTFSDESSEMENFYEEFFIPEDSLYLGYDVSTDSELFSFEETQKGKGSNLFYSFYAEHEEEAEEMKEEEEEIFLKRIPSSAVTETKEFSSKQPSTQQEPRRRSLFVHSSPTHFPDINRARKSVFGSIFLRTTADVTEETALLKTVVESSYTMLQALLNSFEKILSAPYSDKERRKNTLAFRNSIQKALEAHGICKTYADGSAHWYIYPITQNYLFTVQIGDNFHQTRHLSKIEERVLAGSLKKMELPYSWPNGSIWCGEWDALGMAGDGTYSMPHGVSYDGKMQDGMFHDDDATLTYPNKFRAVHCVYEKGKLLDCQFQFPDKLMHMKHDWQYCKFPDRRFWSEVQNGLKPAKIAQKTQIDPPKKVPPGIYDTGDGFYCPKSLMLVNSHGELLRVPVCEEDAWIRKYCRKGFTEPANFRPDLFENWFDYDEELIQSILNMQSKFRAGEIIYDELQQFYADLGLLPTCSNYKKRKSPSEIEMEEYMKTIPPPRSLEKIRKVKKYTGHKFPEEIIAACNLETQGSNLEQPSKIFGRQKFSKSLLKFSKESKSKDRNSQIRISNKSSKISFNIATDLSESSVLNDVEVTSPKRKIPEKYLAYQPVIKSFFDAKSDSKSRTLQLSKSWRKCLPKISVEPSDFSVLGPEDNYDLDFIRLKNLQKFMKNIISEMVTNILVKERERHRKRLIWAREFLKKDPGFIQGVNENCLKILKELFESIPEKEEFCDSYSDKTCDLRKLAEDKHNELKFWGKRMFFLDFDEETKNE